MVRTLALLAVAANSPAPAAPHMFGDPAARTPIDSELRRIYDADGTRLYRMTRGNPLRIPHSRGTEITATRQGDALARIVFFVWTREGKYSAEYFMSSGSLIMTFEAFEYFEESAPRGSWRDFKGLAGWSRRSYFQANAIVYSETEGSLGPAAGADSDRLLKTCRRLIGLFANK